MELPLTRSRDRSDGLAPGAGGGGLPPELAVGLEIEGPHHCAMRPPVADLPPRHAAPVSVTLNAEHGAANPDHGFGAWVRSRGGSPHTRSPIRIGRLFFLYVRFFSCMSYTYASLGMRDAPVQRGRQGRAESDRLVTPSEVKEPCPPGPHSESTRLPLASTVACTPGGTKQVESYSSTMHGPSPPRAIAARATTGVSIQPSARP